MDNPTYDGPPRTAVNHVVDEREFRNPLYSGVSISSPNTTNSNTYEGVYSDGTLVNEGGQTDGGMSGGTASEAMYSVPPDVDNVEDDNRYSALGTTDYSTLQPHISDLTQHQLSPNTDEYSCLQH